MARLRGSIGELNDEELGIFNEVRGLLSPPGSARRFTALHRVGAALSRLNSNRAPFALKSVSRRLADEGLRGVGTQFLTLFERLSQVLTEQEAAVLDERSVPLRALVVLTPSTVTASDRRRLLRSLSQGEIDSSGFVAALQQIRAARGRRRPKDIRASQRAAEGAIQRLIDAARGSPSPGSARALAEAHRGNQSRGTAGAASRARRRRASSAATGARALTQEG